MYVEDMVNCEPDRQTMIQSAEFTHAQFTICVGNVTASPQLHVHTRAHTHMHTHTHTQRKTKLFCEKTLFLNMKQYTQVCSITHSSVTSFE